MAAAEIRVGDSHADDSADSLDNPSHVRLLVDPVSPERLFCVHSRGAHILLAPWLPLLASQLGEREPPLLLPLPLLLPPKESYGTYFAVLVVVVVVRIVPSPMSHSWLLECFNHPIIFRWWAGSCWSICCIAARCSGCVCGHFDALERFLTQWSASFSLHSGR
jgi:hypothetical protein